MSSTLWKKALVDHLINTTKSVNVMLRNQQVRDIVKIPRDINTIEDVNKVTAPFEATLTNPSVYEL